MPRATREMSESGYYHIVLKGAGGQILFDNSSDYRAFISLLRRYSAETEIDVLAYCLMSNHAHMLISDESDNLVTFMRKLCTTFAMRFNSTTGHTGPVFQNRYWSTPIITDEQLLETARYILQNPVKDGIAPIDRYEWSSYAAYMGAPSFVDTTVLLEMLGGADGFASFMALPNTMSDPAPFRMGRISDSAARAIMADVLGEDAVLTLKQSSKASRDESLRKLRDAGIGATQASRLTGIGRATVERAYLKN